MSNTDAVDLQTRRLAGGLVGGQRIVDVQIAEDGTVHVYAGIGSTAETLRLQSGDRTDCRAIAGGLHLMVHDRDQGAPVPLTADNQTVDIMPTEADPTLFEGAKVLLGLRHAETAETVIDWLRFHADRHGSQAALILDCGDPDRRDRFADDLSNASYPDGLSRIVVVTAPLPLGRIDLPGAGHPFNAPAAPGRKRMSGLNPDPQRAPLAETIVFEALHQRFLGKAKAVVSLDVSDILTASDNGSIFDQLARSDSGCLTIAGRECYPWRPRDASKPRFADHLCVQFDQTALRRRWAIVPSRAPDALWRVARLVGPTAGTTDIGFFRCVALRHPNVPVAQLVAKTSLVEDPGLLALTQAAFDQSAVRVPEAAPRRTEEGPGHTTIVTCMKNEGPFILEWLAYHRAIGIDRFLIYSNDCADGTDRLLDLLAERGLVEHRRNPYRESGQKPQHAALQAAEAEPLVDTADWLICMDVDEFINVHVGDGTMPDLYAAVGDANMISLTWRLFGNADISEYSDRPVIERFTRCAPQIARKPHQAWGFKTVYRHLGLFRKLGVHRPKGLIPQLKDRIRWVNGSGQAMPETAYRNAWRSTAATYGYALATLNHYAARSAESFLVKRDRGRVNHVDRDQGLIYWFRMNNNLEIDRSIQRMMPAMIAERERLLQDPEVAQAHDHAVAAHRRKIAELKARDDYATFFAEITSDRMQRLSRLHPHFGSGVFWSGPQVIPDEIAMRDPGDDFFFTVDPVGKGH